MDHRLVHPGKQVNQNPPETLISMWTLWEAPRRTFPVVQWCARGWRRCRDLAPPALQIAGSVPAAATRMKVLAVRSSMEHLPRTMRRITAPLVGKIMWRSHESGSTLDLFLSVHWFQETFSFTPWTESFADSRSDSKSTHHNPLNRATTQHAHDGLHAHDGRCQTVAAGWVISARRQVCDG